MARTVGQRRWRGGRFPRDGCVGGQTPCRRRACGAIGVGHRPWPAGMVRYAPLYPGEVPERPNGAPC